MRRRRSSAALESLRERIEWLESDRVNREMADESKDRRRLLTAGLLLGIALAVLSLSRMGVLDLSLSDGGVA